MIGVVGTSWPLFLGLLLLMVGNGLQGTLLGVRGGIEGFSTLQMSFVMSGYFLGFLGGSRLTPELIRRVGHVRVFAALGSFISAVLVLYPTVTDPWAWTVLRIIIGFSFSGVYVTAESWLNDSATNETRGQTLAIYMIVQMVGIVAGQGLLAIGNPAGFALFVIASVLVSVSFAPVLLSVSPTPAFAATKPMSLRRLFAISPLGCVGTFLLGGAFATFFGMSAVYGTLTGLSVPQISAFVSAIYIGGVLLQFPIGRLSDRIDRRVLVLWLAVIGGAGAVLGLIFEAQFAVLLGAMFIIGGTVNPLYALLIAHTNDYMQPEDMAAASGGMLFLNGIGAVSGPLITGWAMGAFGSAGFFLFLAGVLFILAAYAVWRMTRRPAPAVSETGTYAPVLPSATIVAVEAAQEYFVDHLDGRDDDPQP